jgi:hypothetical protein
MARVRAWGFFKVKCTRKVNAFTFMFSNYETAVRDLNEIS